VTGGMGYIGSHTVVELIESGYDPVIIDNLSNSKILVLDNLKKITNHNIAFEQIDLVDDKKTQECFERHSDAIGVIHFAAFKAVGESVTEPLKYYKNNTLSLINVLDAMKINNIPNIIFSSSCTIYGQPDILPVTEEAPFKKANSPYGNTKQIGENILQNFSHAEISFNCISLRYFNPIGAHPSSDGTAVRDYIHVVDLAKAHVLSMNRLLENKNNTPYEFFNIGTGIGYSVLDVINAFEKTTGLKVNYKIVDRRSGDVEQVYADTTNANNVLGWKAQLSIEEMVNSAWNWETTLHESK